MRAVSASVMPRLQSLKRLNPQPILTAAQQATQGQSKLADACSGRQSSKALLLDHAERLRRKANQLEALAYAVEYIRGDAEGTLYGLLSGDMFRQ